MNKKNEVIEIENLIKKGEKAKFTTNSRGGSGSIQAGPMTGFRSAALSFIVKHYGENHPYFIDFYKSTKSKYISNCEEGIEILKSILIEVNSIGFEFPITNKIDLGNKEELVQKLFLNNEIFDAYQFVSNLIRTANKSIVIIDNFIDDTVLTHIGKKKSDVIVKIYTKKKTKQLQLDEMKFNEQHGMLEIVEFNNSHDRFIIIDDRDIYHFGASLKDLGKKWFAFTKMDIGAVDMSSKLNKL